MTATETWDLLRAAAEHHRRFGNDYPYAEEPTPEDLYQMDLDLERAATVVREAQRWLNGLIVKDIQANGEIRIGDRIYKVTRDTTTRWAFDGADQALVSWIIRDALSPEEGARRIQKVVRIDPGNVRLGEMKALAGLRLHAEDHTASEAAQIDAGFAAFDTFLQRADTDGQPRYVAGRLPVIKAPKWAQNLEPGQRRPREKDTTHDHSDD